MKGERALQITTSILVNYAYGILAPDAAMQVKQALEKDELLRGQYEGIVELIKKYPEEDPEELLAQWAAGTTLPAEPPYKPVPVIKSSRRWLLIAALLIILAGVSTFFFVQSSNRPAAQLAAAMISENHENPYANTTRGSIAPADSTTAWKDAFVNKDYDTVILYLKSKAPLSNEEKFFLALGYLKRTYPQPDKATPLLEQLVNTNHEYTPDAWLYLGLAQALQNKNKEAVESLSHVEQTAQVKDLLERLRR